MGGSRAGAWGSTIGGSTGGGVSRTGEAIGTASVGTGAGTGSVGAGLWITGAGGESLGCHCAAAVRCAGMCEGTSGTAATGATNGGITGDASSRVGKGSDGLTGCTGSTASRALLDGAGISPTEPQWEEPNLTPNASIVATVATAAYCHCSADSSLVRQPADLPFSLCVGFGMTTDGLAGFSSM